MGQGQSAAEAEAPRSDVQDGSHAVEQTPPVTTTTTAAAAALPTAPPTVARMLPPTIPLQPSDATTTYLAKIITEAEEQGASSRHDAALLRFQLDTVRQEATRRQEEHLARLQRELDEERRQHSALPAIVLTDATSEAPRSKKLKPDQTTPAAVAATAASPPKQQPLQSKPPPSHPPPPEPDDTVASIAQQQAQVHAANMAIIAQLRRQLQPESEPSQLTASASQPPSQQPPTPASPPMLTSPASPTWPMDTVAAGFCSTPVPLYDPHESHETQFADPVVLEDDMGNMPASWSPFMPPLNETPLDEPLLSEPTENTSMSPAPSVQSSETTVETTEYASSEPSPAEAPVPSVQPPPGFVKPTAAAKSKVFLANYLESDCLGRLEHEYRAGKFSDVAVRQFLMHCHVLLEPDDHDELMSQFSKMSLKGVEQAIATCPHVDIHPIPGVPCCPQRRDLAEVDSLQLSTAFTHDLSPLEAAPDDADGIARMRFHLFLSPSPNAAATAPLNHKRKMSIEADGETVAPAAASSTSTPPQPPRVYRMLQVNKAFERLAGFTQASLRGGMTRDAKSSGAHDSVRSDHLRANHLIQTNWRLNDINEGHIYQVCKHRDGTELYVLKHTKYHVDHGMMLGVEHAIIPLPVDEDHPPPPFVEGVDLDVDTLLYGYKPPPKTTT